MPHQKHSLADADPDELVARARAGDARAFEAIMRMHNRLLFRTARSLLRNDADSEEAVQDAYLKAWRSLPAFRGDARLSTWLVRIVMNEALSRLRRRKALVVPFSALPVDGEAAQEQVEMEQRDPPQQDPGHMILRRQMRRIVESHIDRLPEPFRIVFIFRALEELNVREVAEMLGIPEATVRTRFFRARALLREALAQDADFATEDAFPFDGERCDRIVAAVLAGIAANGPAGARRT